MALEGINTKFTDPSAKTNYSKLDPNFTNAFYEFLEKINCSEIELNSTFRSGKANGSHSFGRALDINQMVINGKPFYFNFKFGNYSDSDDEAFYKMLLEHFGTKLYNYYSPAIVRHATSKTAINNTFRYSKNKLADVLKAESIPSSKRNWNESHLNHCHLAIDYDGLMTKDKIFANIQNINNQKKKWIGLVNPSNELLSGAYRWRS